MIASEDHRFAAGLHVRAFGLPCSNWEERGREEVVDIASTMRVSSMLPAIKCSSCGAEIEISMMGEHVCSQGMSVP